MKILVIGGSGFIGSHVADYFTSQNHQVVILDIKKSKWIQKSQKFTQGNILDQKLLNKVTKNIDVVYHCAGISDLNEALHKPLETVESNIAGTIKILQACKLNKVKRFIFASSIN